MKKLEKIKNSLSREAMKQIHGGTDDLIPVGGGGCMTQCVKAKDCTYHNCKVCKLFPGQGSFCMTY